MTRRMGDPDDESLDEDTQRIESSAQTDDEAFRAWLPGEIIVVKPRKQWSYAGHPYLSGEIQTPAEVGRRPELRRPRMATSIVQCAGLATDSIGAEAV